MLNDAGTVFRMAGRGLVRQFTDAAPRNTLIFGGIATGGLAFADGKVLSAAKDQPFFRRGAIEAVGDEATVALSFTPLLTYTASRIWDNAKLRAFSLETLSAVTLAYGETIVLSQLPSHRRPRHDIDVGDDSAGFFDSALRGTYSFPSGHLVGPLTLTLKTYDYYGWRWAALPATITVISSISRVSTEHHYPSDIAGAVVLSAAAHLVTRRLAAEEDFQLRVQAAPGGLLVAATWDF